MNDMLANKLEGRKYIYEIAKENVIIITKELNDYLLGRKIEEKPCSYNLCFIMEKPSEYIFDYKIINLKYLPMIASYSNDSLNSKLVLFILNN